MNETVTINYLSSFALRSSLCREESYGHLIIVFQKNGPIIFTRGSSWVNPASPRLLTSRPRRKTPQSTCVHTYSTYKLLSGQEVGGRFTE
jgi:hypothetical protein